LAISPDQGCQNWILIPSDISTGWAGVLSIAIVGAYFGVEVALTTVITGVDPKLVEFFIGAQAETPIPINIIKIGKYFSNPEIPRLIYFANIFTLER